MAAAPAMRGAWVVCWVGGVGGGGGVGGWVVNTWQLADDAITGGGAGLVGVRVGVDVGALVAEATGMGVDLEHPEMTVNIEVIDDRAILWNRRTQGVGVRFPADEKTRGLKLKIEELLGTSISSSKPTQTLYLD